MRANETYSGPSSSLVTKQGCSYECPVISLVVVHSLVCACSARVSHCLRLLVRLVDWYASLLVRLICCRIILTTSSRVSQLICHSLASHCQVLPPLPSDRVRLGAAPHVRLGLWGPMTFLNLALLCRWLLRNEALL